MMNETIFRMTFESDDSNQQLPLTVDEALSFVDFDMGFGANPEIQLEYAE
jgi:hypothetical protein